MKTWQAQLGFVGTILWFCTFDLIKYSRNHDWDTACQVISGYMIGFVTAYCGIALKEILCGRWRRVFGAHVMLKISSIVPMATLLIIGIVGFLTEIFGNTSWQYNISFCVAGLIVTEGVEPTIKYMDNYSTCKNKIVI